MTNSSGDDKKDETKLVLGYLHSEQYPKSDHNFAPSYLNRTYHYPPPYDLYQYQYPYYYYPNYQSNHYNDDTSNNNNDNNIVQPQLSNVPPPRRKIITFCRVLFCLIVVLILSFSIFFVVRIWKNYAYYPSFEVVSFVVHSFNISNSTNKLTADWEVDVRVRNSNRKVEISFEYIATSLMYKLQLLEVSFSAPFDVPGKSNVKFHVDSNIPNLNQVKIGGLVVNEMARDLRRRDNLLIDLRIEANIMNKGSNSYYRRALYVLCDGLMLNFKNSSSLPEWDGQINNYKMECTYDDTWWDIIWQPW
ncbi:uncharacterized protein LOC129877727 [Solanum dulcamara]|uniref:uncharacterized protein LOC129877727 n=1 Tax=Solanum dulcamara TaxID=45834 RepID=UPI002485A17D|nr:uncharacterized protein LOC129877727 [Solanum dulcamara]